MVSCGFMLPKHGICSYDFKKTPYRDLMNTTLGGLKKYGKRIRGMRDWRHRSKIVYRAKLP